MARKAVRLEMKSTVETVSSLSLESFQHTGQTLAAEPAYIFTISYLVVPYIFN